MTLLLDAGALIAVDRGDRSVLRRLKSALREGMPPRTHGAVVGQVWRNGSRQARLASALRHVEVVGLNETLGRSAGILLARAGASDVVDAALVALAHDGDVVLTSNVEDIAHLARAGGVHVDVVPV